MTVLTESEAEITEELVARAAALVPMLRANAERTERDRRIADENMAALREYGLLKVSLSRAYGGYELGMRSFLRICAELGRGCGSTSWVTTLLNTNAYTIATFPEQAQDDVYGSNPDAVVCGVILGNGVETKQVDGGHLVSGQWGFASGSLHSDWAMLGRVPLDDGHGGVLVSMADLEIRDTWHVAGMRGTGSNTLVAKEVFVPHHRVLFFDRTLTDADLRATPSQKHAVRRAVFTFGLVAPLLGLAQQAFELVMSSLEKGKPIAYSAYTDARKSTSTQLALAQAAQLIDSAWLHAFRSADDLDDAEAGRTVLDMRTQVRIRMDVGLIAQQSRSAVELLLNVNGAGSFADANPLQRVWRDVEVATRHGIINPLMAQEIFGKILVGDQTVVWGE